MNLVEKMKNLIKHHMLTPFANNKEDTFKGKTKTQKYKMHLMHEKISSLLYLSF